MRKGLRLKQRLSSIDTKTGRIGTGITVGSDSGSVTADGDKIKAGRFRVLWFERKTVKTANNILKTKKYLRRKTIPLDNNNNSNRDQAEQIIEGISRLAGQIADRRQ
jgi:hypothetical protein